MPTVLLLDASLSMAETAAIPDTTEVYQLKHLAREGLITLLDHISKHVKFENVSLVTFSSQCQTLVPFTRDLCTIKVELREIELFDSTALIEALEYVKRYILEQWGIHQPCQVILVTDGSIGVGPNSLCKIIEQLEETTLPFPFPCKLHVVSIKPPKYLDIFNKLVKLNNPEGKLYIPESPLSFASIQQTFQKIADSHYSPFASQLVCGHFNSHVTLFPPLDTNVNELEKVGTITICGFLSLADVSDPPILSKHLVLPISSGGNENCPPQQGTYDNNSEGCQPAFTVLLHGGLKRENMVAFCHLVGNWYGILHSGTESKKKLNLTLSTFKPGLNSVPWLGNFLKLGPKNENSSDYKFPVKTAGQKSYTKGCVVWLEEAKLKADIIKILKHAKKIPDKTQSFYKEINRFREACLSFGFIELLNGTASLLERECLNLSPNCSPEVSIQLTHVAIKLRAQKPEDYETPLTPL